MSFNEICCSKERSKTFEIDSVSFSKVSINEVKHQICL